MKNLIIYLNLLLSFTTFAQTDPPTLIINLDKVGIYEDMVDSQVDDLEIKAVVFNHPASDPSSLYPCMEQEYLPFTVRDNTAYLYFLDSNCNSHTIIEKGDLIMLSIKRENKLMNVFVYSNVDVGIDQTLRIENLSFKDGKYLYDIPNKDVEFVMNPVIELSSIYLIPVNEQRLKCLKRD